MNNKTPLLEIIFSKRVCKFLLFLTSYMMAVLFMLLMLFIQGEDIHPVSGFAPALYVFPLGFVYLLQFLFPNSEVYNFGFYIGWATYLIITACAVVIQNHQTARILYFIFVLSLISNIYGCTIAGN